jgi:hypothetical protein
MSKAQLKIVKQEQPEVKRVLPESKPMALNPPQFETELINFYNPNIKWWSCLERIQLK